MTLLEKLNLEKESFELPEKPKPNQENEKSEIEKIILESFKIPCKVQIYAFVLPNSRFNGEPEYDHLVIKMEGKYVDEFRKIDLNNARSIDFNNTLNKYGIKKIKVVSSEEGRFY